MTLANKLTMLRVFMIPLYVVCFYIPIDNRMIIATVIFVLAYFTDLLDGYIARHYNQVTDFGKLMDPMADKLLTAAALVFMLCFDMFPKYLGEAFVFVTIAREFIISAYRMVAASKGNVIAAGILGKAKTMMQFVTLTVIMIDSIVLADAQSLKLVIDSVLISVTLILTVWSLIVCLVGSKASKTAEG